MFGFAQNAANVKLRIASAFKPARPILSTWANRFNIGKSAISMRPIFRRITLRTAAGVSAVAAYASFAKPTKAEGATTEIVISSKLLNSGCDKAANVLAAKFIYDVMKDLEKIDLELEYINNAIKRENEIQDQMNNRFDFKSWDNVGENERNWPKCVKSFYDYMCLSSFIRINQLTDKLQEKTKIREELLKKLESIKEE